MWFEKLNLLLKVVYYVVKKVLLKNPNVYMDMRDDTRWNIYILCHMQEILKRWEGVSICRISWKINTRKLTIDTINTKIISNLSKKRNFISQKMTNSMLKVPVVAYNVR